MRTPRRHSFLIVDDEPEVLIALNRLFRRDYEILTATNAADGMDLLARHDVQLVMSDQRMPHRGGVAFLEDVRRQYPNAIRILITGYSDISSVVAAINQGHVYSYVTKPWVPEHLLDTIAKAALHFDLMEERRTLLAELAATNQTLDERNAQLARANEDLKQLDRLKTVFMELISHELNTPIAIILGYAFLLEKELAPPTGSNANRALRGINSSAQRLRNITAKVFRVLSSASPDVDAHFERVSLATICDEATRVVAPFIDKRAQRLEVSCPTDVSAELDPQQITDALVNLLMNAIKFSHDGGTIGLSTVVDDDTVVITVADHGVGINDEDLPRIFESFFGTFNSKHHSSGEYEFKKRGIGLGLAMVRRYAELHHGSVEVHSQEDAGSSFVLRLPLRQPGERAQA